MSDLSVLNGVSVPARSAKRYAPNPVTVTAVTPGTAFRFAADWAPGTRSGWAEGYGTRLLAGDRAAATARVGELRATRARRAAAARLAATR